MEFFKIFKNGCSKANNKINELWQSENENFKNVQYLMWLFFVGIIEITSMVCIKPKYGDMIHTMGVVIICYMAILCVFVSIVAGLTHLYVFGRKKYKKCWIQLFKFIYKIILLLQIITSIPFIIILFLIGIVLEQGAKKIDNIIHLSFLMIVIMSIFIFLLPINVSFILIMLKRTDSVFVFNNIEYNHNFIMILMFIFISMVEINTLTNLGLKIIKRNRLKKIKKSESRKIFTIDSEERVKYDLNYFKKSIWRFELIGLIFLFIVAAVTKNIFPSIETEVKDAATVVTLGMLYWDKRKEWNFLLNKNNETKGEESENQ